MSDAVVVGAVRTPVGRRKGSLAGAHPVDLSAHVLRALDDAEFCGAVPLADRAAAELRVAGFRPRRNRLTGPAALTPSELRVAELAAGGSSNREIAQALFVTTKTVELHLSNAYRKLSVSGRRNLAAALEP